MNMPVMGFWPAINASLQARGFCEYDGVKLAGLFGKYTLVVDFSTNLSFHSKMPYNPDSLKQTSVRSKAIQTFDASKKYVALVMQESGDSPG